MSANDKLDVRLEAELSAYYARAAPLPTARFTQHFRPGSPRHRLLSHIFALIPIRCGSFSILCLFLYCVRMFGGDLEHRGRARRLHGAYVQWHRQRGHAVRSAVRRYAAAAAAQPQMETVEPLTDALDRLEVF